MTIGMLFNDEQGIGYAFIWEDEKIKGMMYQNRLPQDLIDEGAPDMDIFNFIDESSKAYAVVGEELLDVVNQCLDFWFMQPIEEVPELDILTLREAISALKDNDFIIYEEDVNYQ